MTLPFGSRISGDTVFASREYGPLTSAYIDFISVSKPLATSGYSSFTFQTKPQRQILHCLLFTLLSALIGTGSLQAAVRLPAIFSDGMVLQRSTDTPVWGNAAPGDAVSVTIADQTSRATADGKGRWMVRLNLDEIGPGPHEVRVAGTNQIALADVLVGEVWLASGQSNMEFPVRLSSTVDAAVAKSANAQLREYKVRKTVSDKPQEDSPGQWTAAGPDTVGQMSAVAYFFASRLQEALDCPVGIVNSSYGGSDIETWLSAKAIASNSELSAGCKLADEAFRSYPERMRSYMAACREWIVDQQRSDQQTKDVASYAAPGVDTSDWQKVVLPGVFSQNDLPANGVVWLRKTVPINAERANQRNIVNLGHVRDFDQVYWNGQLIGETSLDTPMAPLGREYDLPPTPEGDAMLAVRVFSPLTPGEISASRNSFRVGNDPSNMFFLEGEWLAKSEIAFPRLSATAAALPTRPPQPMVEKNLCSRLYNGMIHPLEPYGIRGFIWYQGESNDSRAWQYRESFPLLIQSLRKAWGAELPFYFCQLAAYREKSPQPGDSQWAELREAQSLALRLPATGQAVLIDVGEAADIHPRDKQTAGNRLAALALARTYQQNIPASGPVFQEATVRGNSIRLTFANTEGQLAAKPLADTYPVRTAEAESRELVPPMPESELQGFSICGADRKWRWAEARIDGETIIVSADDIRSPVAVRYAWEDNPTANLVNASGLPASPFRSDDFPLRTRDAKFPD